MTIEGVEYEFDEKGVIVPDEWGLTLTAKDVTPTSCTIVFTQSGGNPTGDLETCDPFEIERYKNGKWTAVELVPNGYEFAWLDEASFIYKNKDTEFKHGWSDLYGELPAGKYRISKEVFDWRKQGDSDKKMYYAYFKIDTE